MRRRNVHIDSCPDTINGGRYNRVSKKSGTNINRHVAKPTVRDWDRGSAAACRDQKSPSPLPSGLCRGLRRRRMAGTGAHSLKRPLSALVRTEGFKSRDNSCRQLPRRRCSQLFPGQFDAGRRPQRRTEYLRGTARFSGQDGSVKAVPADEKAIDLPLRCGTM